MFIGGEVLKVVLSLVSMLVVFCDMASITGILPIFIGVSWRQSFGFFSIVESETLWQVKL